MRAWTAKREAKSDATTRRNGRRTRRKPRRFGLDHDEAGGEGLGRISPFGSGLRSPGLLEAREEGEGVTKRFIVSIDSLNALRERRSGEALAAEEFAELRQRPRKRRT
jgi:hypothetical protein